jgi:hypothetical protein
MCVFSFHILIVLVCFLKFFIVVCFLAGGFHYSFDFLSCHKGPTFQVTCWALEGGDKNKLPCVN